MVPVYAADVDIVHFAAVGYVNTVDISTESRSQLEGNATMDEPNLHVVAGLGAVGRAVVGELVARGLPVRAVARHRASGLPAGVDVIEADMADPASARRALAGAAVVYHAASAPYDRWPALLPRLMKGVIEGASATGARVVYADNLYAYGPVAGPLTEDLPYRAADPTAASARPSPTS